ncbi:MAG: T9SS type A sorting domain-containing protein, partial [Bacteroidia bacterium]
PEPQEALALQVFPQPASDHVTLDLRAMKPEAVAVQISDLSGRSIRAYELRGGKMETLDLSDLAPGAYAIVAKTRSEIRTGKLIKAAR